MNPRKWISNVCVLLSVLLISPGVWADPGGGDAADDASTASTLGVGSYSATLTAGDEDWYRLAVPVLNKVTVTVAPDCSDMTSRDFDLALYEGDGTSLISSSSNGACASETVHCWANANQAVYARVHAPTGDTGAYTITVTQTLVPTTSPFVPDTWCTL